MSNNDYMEKLLGEQYNMKNYYVDTYTEPQVNIIKTTNQDIHKMSTNEKTNQESEEKTEEDTRYVISSQKEEKEIQQTNVNQEQMEPEIKNFDSFQITNLYPDIFKAIDPIVELSVSNLINTDINEEVIESITTKIYNAVEPSKIQNNQIGEMPVHGRPHNNMLYDLIKILILNKLRPIPPHNHRPIMPPPPMPRNYNAMKVSNNMNYKDVPYPEDDV